MKTLFSDFFLYFFAAAFTQNLILTTGLGSSLLLRFLTKPHGMRSFSASLIAFCLVTSCSFYPLDKYLLSTSVLDKMLRPVICIAIIGFWYLVSILVVRKAIHGRYAPLQATLTYAAFNNMVIGLMIIANHQFTCDFLGTIGLSLGACVGFLIMMSLTKEAMARMNNPDIPKAFQGFPSALLFLGILALALCGFTSPISFL